jgi:hypothetical protein
MDVVMDFSSPVDPGRFATAFLLPAFCHRCHKDRHGKNVEKRGKDSGIMGKYTNILPLIRVAGNDDFDRPIRTRKFARPHFFRFRLIAGPFPPIVAPSRKRPT